MNDDVTKVMKVDSTTINFGSFVCGKMLGSSLQIENTTNQEQIIEISVDLNSEKYFCDEILGPYSKQDIPFEYQDGETIRNAEKELKCWFIENPVSKELVKSMTVRFGPKVSKDFIVVLKVPSNKLSFNIASFISIKLANLRRQQSLVSQSQEEEK